MSNIGRIALLGKDSTSSYEAIPSQRVKPAGEFPPQYHSSHLYTPFAFVLISDPQS